MKVSYCTLCKGRRHQMEITLPANLDYISDKDAEIVLVDWCSGDGLSEWVMENFKVFLDSGKLRMFRLSKDLPFSIPVGKNFAHRLARGGILFNLDADNFAEGSFEHASLLGRHEIQGCNVYNLGIYGRIALSRESFEKLGGYDEKLLPAGGQDRDLLDRATASGLSRTNHMARRMALKNSKLDTISEIEGSRSWESMNEQNCKQSLQNIARGLVRANQEGFIPATFLDHNGFAFQLGSCLWPEEKSIQEISQKHPRFIALITYGRTGSTALQFALNRQKGVLVRGENHNAFRELFSFYQALRKGKAQGENYPRHPWFGANLWNPERVLDRMRDIAVNEILCPKIETSVIGFKEIRHTPRQFKNIKELTEYIIFLIKLFPEIKILLNRRNPHDTSRSGWWSSNPDSEKLLATCHDWFGRLAGILESLAGYPVATLVDYESWSISPASLKPAWDFLGLEWCEADVIEALSIRLKH